MNLHMKYFVSIFICLSLSVIGYAQNKIPVTDSFTVEGQVKNPSAFTLSMLDTFKAKSLNDVVTVNHMGEALKTIKGAKGILLKDVLAGIQLKSPSPKQLFSYYLECVASDGFKVVFSRNEIFSTMNGDNTYILTEEDGKKLKDTDDRIAILIMLGNGKGHVYMKGLKQIIFKSVIEE